MSHSQTLLTWAQSVLGKPITANKTLAGDQSVVFQIIANNRKYFLKIAPSLEAERDRLVWLQGKFSAPKVVGFTHIAGNDAILMTALPGKTLKDLIMLWSPEKIVQKLAQAIQSVHSLDISDCPFGNHTDGYVVVHGDACLPNFLFDGDVFSGVIDVGEMRVAHPNIDLSAAVWSLQHNLGPGYGKLFLERYGISHPTDEQVESLRIQYESWQNEHGL